MLFICLFFEEIVVLIRLIDVGVEYFIVSIVVYKYVIVVVLFFDFEEDEVLFWVWEVVCQGFFIGCMLFVEVYQVFIDQEQEVKGIDQGVFVYVIGAYQLQGVAVFKFDFCYFVGIGVNEYEFGQYS